MQRVNEDKQYQKYVTLQLVSIEDLLQREKQRKRCMVLLMVIPTTAAWMALTLIVCFYSIWGLYLFVNGEVKLVKVH